MDSHFFSDRVGLDHVNAPSVPNFDKYCFLHKNSNHDLTNCINFQTMTYDDRVQLVKEARLCFRCFGAHFIRDCDVNVNCELCGSRHHTLLHNENYRKTNPQPRGTSNAANYNLHKNPVNNQKTESRQPIPQLMKIPVAPYVAPGVTNLARAGEVLQGGDVGYRTIRPGTIRPRTIRPKI